MFFCRLLSLDAGSGTIENQPVLPEFEEHGTSHDEPVSTQVSRSASMDSSLRPKSAGSGHKRKGYIWSTEEMKMLERLQNSLLEAVGRMRYNCPPVFTNNCALGLLPFK